MIMKYFQSSFLAFVVALIAINAPAQTTTGTVLGYVTDSSGARLNGAKVTVTNEATGFTRTVTTNTSGEYVIALLPVGRYTVTVEAASFKQRLINGLVLKLDQKARIDVV